MTGSVAPSTTSIIWKHRDNAGVVVKVIEWDREEDSTDIPNAKFRSHATLDKSTGNLNLKNLQLKHSGTYTVDINSKEQRKKFTLTVMGEDVKKAVGDTVSFRPANINPPVTSIMWKQRSSSGILVKVIEWDDDGFVVPNQRFKGITALDEKTGQITITKLTVEHSGVYTIDINRKEQEQRFLLNVVERVPKPVIKTEMSTNPDVVYFICEYSETIIWKNSSGEKLKGSEHYPKGEFIAVEKQGRPENYYTCTLKNAISEETSDPVYERDLFKDSNTSLAISIVIPLIVVVLIILILFLIIRFQGEDVKKAVGDVVCFRPDKIHPNVTSLIWKQRSSSGIVVKAIEWDDDGTKIPNQRFQNITTLNNETGEITISKLTVKHSGVYTIDINSKEQEQRFLLTVVDSNSSLVISIIIPLIAVVLVILLLFLIIRFHGYNQICTVSSVTGYSQICMVSSVTVRSLTAAFLDNRREISI
ncbi:SLAM family member 7-like isoform X1 [Labeo rohita]|uniref:SLAM family member 7-like isoform X1 n=1 Tax=Labeo rohita TaxID=84645 RepID=A0A498M641_LABRO|nr:SLAM family member 7-like isoform X1 [Labeo rohita]